MTETKYPIAERFKSVQGEGVYAGTPMAFIRFVGCSVGKKICTHCDTDFDKPYTTLGGGMYTVEDLQTWIGNYRHVCITGGEPLDRDLSDLLYYLCERASIDMIHIETSGTVHPKWWDEQPFLGKMWLTVCPKPGYRYDMLHEADEIKVILGGLGDGEGWPTLADAINWSYKIDGSLSHVPVFIQPRNEKHHVDRHALQEAVKIVENNPTLRLSMQTHKLLQVR